MELEQDMLRLNTVLRAGVCALAIAAFAPAFTGTASAQQVERVEKGNLVLENVPAADPELADKFRAYLNARSAGFAGWTADGSGILITTRFGEVNQLHLVRQPMGAREQITFAEEPITNGEFRPVAGSNELIYVWDKGGSEYYQLFHLDLDSGDSRMLTDGKSRNQSFLWSHKGDRIAFTSTRRNDRDTDVYVAAPEQVASARPVAEMEGSYSPIAFSQDDSRLLIGQYISVTRSFLYIADLKAGTVTKLRPELDNVSQSAVGFTPDGKGVFILSDEAGEFRRLGVLDIAGGGVRWVSEDIPWDVEDVTLSKDGSTIAYAFNEGGWSSIRLLDTASLQHKPAPDLPKGVVGSMGFSPDGKRLAISISQPTAPGDVFVADIASGEVKQWTKSEVGGLNTETFATAELIEYPTFDQVDGKPRMIPSFLYTPRNAQGKLPVIISIHGGPEAQSRPSFSSTYQFWANELGAAVLVPNVRGSTGYGKTYVTLDNGFKREDSVKDIGALIDWVATQPNLDKDRIALVGGSYGGYMVLAGMTHYNDRLAGAVDIVGISNFVTFLESTKEYRRDLRRPEYGDERDPAMREHLLKISPLTNAHKITKPMLIVQGANDPRVPRSEAEQILAQIRANGGDAWYVLAMDEGHGFRKKANQFEDQMARAMFLRKILGQATN